MRGLVFPSIGQTPWRAIRAPGALLSQIRQRAHRAAQRLQDPGRPAAVFRLLLCSLAILAFVPPVSARAGDPIRLKLAFYTSDRANLYLAWVKPFVEAVNAEGRDLVQIDVYFGGVLGKAPEKQPELVLSGVADLALIMPAYSPERFYDSDVLELPGLFNDMREGTLTFTRLLAINAFKSYQDFVVIGSYASEPETIHSRRPIASLQDLHGLRIRTNSRAESSALKKLGAITVPIPINQTPDALGRGDVDAATVPPAMLSEFGIQRAVSNHFMLRSSSALLALVMNRRKFDSLPPEVQRIIRKYSGEWLAWRCISAFNFLNEEALQILRADPRRKVIFPSQSDRQAARAAFADVREEWVAGNPQRAQLLAAVERELGKLRAAEQ